MQMSVKRRAKIAAILASLLVNGIVVYLMLGQWLEQSSLAALIHQLLNESTAVQSIQDPQYAQNMPAQQAQPTPAADDEDDWVTLVTAQGSQDDSTACVVWDDPHVADSSVDQSSAATEQEEADSDVSEEISQENDPALDTPDITQQENDSAAHIYEPEEPEPTFMLNDAIEQLPPAQAPPSAQPSKKKRTKKKKNANTSFTLNDLVNGFVNSAPIPASGYADGGSSTNMQGSHAGKASIKQIMTRHYLEKVFNALQNSFRVNKSRLRAMPTMYSNKQASIGMALDKKGNIMHLELIDTSSDFELDQFLLFVFKDAQGTYPTIPDAMEVEYYPVMYNNVLGLLQGSFSMATVSRVSNGPPPPIRTKNFP
jgi:hypothetical protein